jgi:hypothetical protein
LLLALLLLLAASLLLLASKLWQVFLLLLASLYSFLWVTVAGLPAIAGIPGVASLNRGSNFELAAAGGPAVIAFSAVDGVLAVASIPADPGVPILAGGFTYWTV